MAPLSLASVKKWPQRLDGRRVTFLIPACRQTANRKQGDNDNHEHRIHVGTAAASFLDACIDPGGPCIVPTGAGAASGAMSVHRCPGRDADALSASGGHCPAPADETLIERR